MRELLALREVSAGYGDAVVISHIDLRLVEGESLAVLGRNGTGKTTLLNTIVGITRHHGGRIELAGRDLTAMRPYRRAAAGVGWVPQERNIFKSLTVEENLTAVARPGPGRGLARRQILDRRGLPAARRQAARDGRRGLSGATSRREENA